MSTEKMLTRCCEIFQEQIIKLQYIHTTQAEYISPSRFKTVHYKIKYMGDNETITH